MVRVRVLAGTVLVAALAVTSTAAGQSATDRAKEDAAKYTKTDVKRVVAQFDHDARAFRSAARRDVDPKDLEDVAPEERLDGPLVDLARATDRLRVRLDGADDWWKTRDEAREVVSASRVINTLFGRVYAYVPVRPRWLGLRKHVNELSRMYSLEKVPEPPVPPKPVSKEKSKVPKVPK